MTVRIETPEEMTEFGVKLARRLRAGDLVVLTGPLGAGKTTMVRGIGEGLEVRGPVTSPTFVLARTHPSLVGGPPLVHVDAYRLSSPLELDDLDIDFVGSVVVVEWGAGMLDGVAESWLELQIQRPVGAAVDVGTEPAATVAGSQARYPQTDDPQSSDAQTSDVQPGDVQPGDVQSSEGLDLGEELVEPRTITVTPVGARWADSSWSDDYC